MRKYILSLFVLALLVGLNVKIGLSPQNTVATVAPLNLNYIVKHDTVEVDNGISIVVVGNKLPTTNVNSQKDMTCSYPRVNLNNRIESLDKLLTKIHLEDKQVVGKIVNHTQNESDQSLVAETR